MEESRKNMPHARPDDRDLQELLIAGCKGDVPSRTEQTLPQETASAVARTSSTPRQIGPSSPRQTGTSTPRQTGTPASTPRSSASHVASGSGGRRPPRGNRRKRRRRMIWTAAVVLLLLLLAAGAVWMYGQSAEDAQEERDYACLTEKNFCLEDYENFLAKYPHSAHAKEVRRHLNELRNMYARWRLIETSVHVADFRQFMKDYPYPSCPLYLACTRRVDSLDWVYAATAHTREAVGAYLTQHPEGAWLMEAQQVLDSINGEQALREARAIEDSLAKIVEEQNSPL